MQPILKIKGLSVVLVGSFNPAIFHPSWFSANKLIGQQEADNARIEIVHPDAAIFTTDWLTVSVDRQRFQVATIQETHFELLRDLVLGTFELLCYTPLLQMGINRTFHFGLLSNQNFYSLCNGLAPNKKWQTVLQDPNMASLVVHGGRKDELPGFIGVRVEPSSKVPSGIFIEVNDHYELTNGTNTALSSLRMLELLAKQWSKSLERSLTIAEKITALESKDASHQ